MEFNPSNNVVKLCIQGMVAEERSREEAERLFLKAWNETENDFERYLAAYYVARQQIAVADRLKWLESALRFAKTVNSPAVISAFPNLYSKIAECYEEMGEKENAKLNRDLAASFTGNPTDEGPFYHGTRADLKIGDLLNPGGASNYQADLIMNHIYFTALGNGAGLAAALAKGDGRERVYIVEPTGSFENDPNVTDKKFPGNATRSYRSLEPLKIVGELDNWIRQTPEQLASWREKLANTKGEIIN